MALTQVSEMNLIESLRLTIFFLTDYKSLKLEYPNIVRLIKRVIETVELKSHFNAVQQF